MPRNQAPRRRSMPPAKPAKAGTPFRNGVMIVILVAFLVVMAVLLPQSDLLTSANPNDEGGQEVLPLRISEVMASNKRAYPDDHGNYSDWVEIENTGQASVNLSNIGLSDREDRVLFIFPNIDLAAGERIVVFCDDSNASEAGMPLHARFKISALGETIYLFDRSTNILDSVEVPALPSDVSYALTPGGWITTEQFTPGYPNTEAGFADFKSEGLISSEGLMLNEIVASNITTLADEDGEYPDWIELYNSSSVAINLSNYALSDDETDPIKWRFPQNAVIQPGEYYIVFASGKDRVGGNGNHPHTNFGLAAEGETVVLSDILRQTIDRVTYDNLGKDLSYGRVEGLENAWQVYQQPTPGMPNNRESELIMDARMRASNTTGVFISEVVTSSTGVETPYGNTSYDWIEIVNRSNSTVDLTGWGLSDSIGRPRQWQFGSKQLGPGEYLLVFPSGYLESPVGSDAVHADFRLSALGETIVLSDPQGNIVDKLVIPKLERNNSYGRNFDQGGLFYYETPTAAAANTTQGFAGYAEAPTIDTKGGVFAGNMTVTIEAPAGVHIRYTLDGSDPTTDVGSDYDGPITLTERTVLRARGFVDGLKPSDTVTETYLINTYHIFPIVSIVTDPDNLYNADTGILAEDPEVKALETKTPFDDLTYWKKIPHDANFEYFVDGVQVVNQQVELQLHGQFSMDQAQKSFRVTARQRYGSPTLNYPFFDTRTFTEYQSIILRNGGQDGKWTRIIDALQARIVEWTDTTVLTMADQPIIAFVNGEYWGHYNLRERINKYAIAAYEGWDDPENMDLIKGNGSVITGDFADQRALRAYLDEHDLNDSESMQTILDWVDVDNYMDFIIFQMYFGNTDTGNIKYYRQKAPGAKWKWIIFDLDWGFFDSKNDGCYIWLKEAGAGEKKINNILIRRLLEVPEMQDKFLTRYGQLFQDYLSDTDRILAEAHAMLNAIEPELPMHFNRWAGLNSPLVSEEPTTPESLYRYWSDRVTRMDRVIKRRPNLVWGHVQDWFKLSDAEMESYFGPRPEMPPEVAGD